MTVGLWDIFTKTKEVLQKADGAVYIPIAGKAGSCTAPVGLTCITLKVLLHTKNRVIFGQPYPLFSSEQKTGGLPIEGLS